jgi:hypothetical protein
MTRNPRGSSGEYHDANSDDSRQLSRRAAVGAIAAAVGGGTVLVATTGDAEAAEVSVDELRVDDATFEAEQVDPVAEATVAYAYRYQGANEIRLWLGVDDSELASVDLSTSTDTAEGTETLTGRVVDASTYSLGAFATEPGETISRDVSFTVGIEVLENGTVTVSDETSQTATIEVTNPDDGEPYARIGGEIVIRDASA